MVVMVCITASSFSELIHYLVNVCDCYRIQHCTNNEASFVSLDNRDNKLQFHLTSEQRQHQQCCLRYDSIIHSANSM